MLVFEETLRDIEDDDRFITVMGIQARYPFLTIKDIFEILEDPLLVETMIIDIGELPGGVI